MTIEETQEKANKLRAIAKTCAYDMFQIPKGYASGTVDRMIDSIISCAILEVAILQNEAIVKNCQSVEFRDDLGEPK